MNEVESGVTLPWAKAIGSGPEAVVLLHGWLHSSRRWEHLAPRLAEHMQVLLVDLPGFGRSRGVKLHEFHIHELAVLTSQVVSNHVRSNTVGAVVGDSLGALVALHLTSKQLLSPGKLVLSGCPALGLSLGTGILLPPLVRLCLGLLPVLPDSCQDALIRLFGRPLVRRRRVIDSGYCADVKEADPITSARLLKAIARFSLREYEFDRALPTLAIRGEYDRIASVRATEVLRQALGANVVSLPGCGHTTMSEDPERYGDHVIEFLMH